MSTWLGDIQVSSDLCFSFTLPTWHPQSPKFDAKCACMHVSSWRRCPHYSNHLNSNFYIFSSNKRPHPLDFDWTRESYGAHKISSEVTTPLQLQLTGNDDKWSMSRRWKSDHVLEVWYCIDKYLWNVVERLLTKFLYLSLHTYVYMHNQTSWLFFSPH